ncbi:MAG: diaminopimelate epimerase [Clostridiales bacterium]|nr:diaminopimelate epimerase [Clostridiales bacterium]
MKLSFVKMQGCGNDYIYFDCFKQAVNEPEKLAVTLSDRHFGIGGDGLVLILPSDCADAKMRMFNIDGSEGKMCGNAIRCVAKYLYESGLAQRSELMIETLSGVKRIALQTLDDAERKICVRAKVDMGAAIFEAGLIPTILEPNKVFLSRRAVLDKPFEIGGDDFRVTCVSMGNPHAVVFMQNIKKAPLIDSNAKLCLANLDLLDIGPKFEKNPAFPESVNTEFVEVISVKELSMRVWERGSGETLACGTGACAAVAAAVACSYCKEGDDITVHLKGGDLAVNFSASRVMMTGGCEKAFEGVVDIVQY